MRFGGGTVAVAIVVLAMAGQLVQGQAPLSRGLGYRASVDLTLPIDSPGRGVIVLQTENFQVWLEGDVQDKCSLSVRQIYGGRGNFSGRGYLLWSANYYSRTPAGADRCTLSFTAGGELQLFILYRGSSSLTWTSNTAGQGVTRMALVDNGNFQLLTAGNKAVFQSFYVNEWLVLSEQKFWAGALLKSPDQVYNESDTNLLANSGKYIMAIKGGDLQLLINGPKPQVYWSLKAESSVRSDLSKVGYAAVVVDADNTKGDGIGLYTAGGSLVYRIAVPEWTKDFGRYFHFGLDTFGNLKYFLQFRGIFWWVGWQAFTDLCNLPGYCGQYGVCSSFVGEFGTPGNSCTCPQGFKPAGSAPAAGCARRSYVNKCQHTKYLELSGYESAYLRYVTPTVQSLTDCKASCSSDCKCDGVFYKANARQCFKVTQFLTLKKTSTTTDTVTAFIKVK